jgi:hypothetical protein
VATVDNKFEIRFRSFERVGFFCLHACVCTYLYLSAIRIGKMTESVVLARRPEGG